MNNRAALDWVNFLLANVKDGLGPFLAVYLLASQHWTPAELVLATVAARHPSARSSTGPIGSAD
jgi:hypothetical protein